MHCAALAEEMGVKAFPTLQFWKNNDMLYQNVGAGNAERIIGEGALFYGGQGAQGELTSTHIKTVSSKQDLADFFEAR